MKIEISFKYNKGVFCNIVFTMIFNMKFTLLTFITNPHFKFDSIYFVFKVIKLFKTWSYNITMKTFLILNTKREHGTCVQLLY